MLTKDLAERLLADAEAADRQLEWPALSWQSVTEAGVLGWSIPPQFDGKGLDPLSLQRGLEWISSHCLTVAFAISQREAAIRHLLRAPRSIQDRYLPQLATTGAYATVGLSQLTTSRQHLGPALRASENTDGSYQLEGEIPWVTGADQAIVVIAGATLECGRQLLLALPGESLVGFIEPPLPLAALSGSRTSLIRCSSFRVGSECVLAGPVENVLGTLGGGGLDTSCLGLGLASSAIERIQQESVSRVEFRDIAAQLTAALQANRGQLHHLATTPGTPDEILSLRTRCTTLALRATQVGLMVAKGAGFIAPHAAQRWARQALFFLVWSCPRPVTQGLLAELSDV